MKRPGIFSLIKYLILYSRNLLSVHFADFQRFVEAFRLQKFPSSMNMTRLATSLAKPISCVTITIVIPCSANFFITFKTSPTISGVECRCRLIKSMMSGFIAGSTSNSHTLLFKSTGSISGYISFYLLDQLSAAI